MSLTKIIAKGTVLTSLTTLLVKLIGMLSIFLILRRFGAIEYGALELALSLIPLLSIFMLPGLDSLIVADMGVHRGKGDLSRARGVLSSFFVLQMMLALFAWAILFFAADVFAGLYHVPIHYVRMASIFFLLSPIRTMYGVLFRVHLLFFHQSLLTFLEEASKLLFLGLFFLVLNIGIVGVLIAMVGSQVFALAALSPSAARLWRDLRGGEPGVTVWWSFLWGRGAWSILGAYLSNAGRSARLFIIQYVLGKEAVGLYAVAIGLIGHTIALVPLSSVIAPMLPQYAHDREHFTRLLNKAMKYQFIAYLGVGSIGFLAFPTIITFLFPAYAAAMPLFQIMLIGLLPVAFISVLTPAFFALKLQKSFFVSILFKTAVSVVFTYALITLFGIWGLAYEYTLTSLVYGLERLRNLRKHIPGVSISHTYLFSFDNDDRLLLGKIIPFLRKTAYSYGKTNE